MTEDRIRQLIKASTFGKRLCVDVETCNPDVITPNEVDELANVIWVEMMSEALFD